MKVVDWSALGRDERAEVTTRGTAAAGPEVTASVVRTLAAVRAHGDAAVVEATARYDGVQLAGLAVSPAQVQQARARLSPALREAITEAAGRIRTFHAAGRITDYAVDTAPGVRC